LVSTFVGILNNISKCYPKIYLMITAKKINAKNIHFTNITIVQK
jgi:hypothetical protein